jgi:hypothetical protein
MISLQFSLLKTTTLQLPLPRWQVERRGEEEGHRKEKEWGGEEKTEVAAAAAAVAVVVVVVEECPLRVFSGLVSDSRHTTTVPVFYQHCVVEYKTISNLLTYQISDIFYD